MDNAKKHGEGIVTLSEFARLAGVFPPTILHHLRKGRIKTAPMIVEGFPVEELERLRPYQRIKTV